MLCGSCLDVSIIIVYIFIHFGFFISNPVKTGTGIILSIPIIDMHIADV